MTVLGTSTEELFITTKYSRMEVFKIALLRSSVIRYLVLSLCFIILGPLAHDFCFILLGPIAYDSTGNVPKIKLGIKMK